MNSTINLKGGATRFASTRGFTLVELMISMLIGLLVVAAASTMFVSNRQAYATTEVMGRMQENGRVAFEVMARSLREAGGTPCGNNIPIVSTVSRSDGSIVDWSSGLRGFVGTIPAGIGGEPSNRVAGTDALYMEGGSSGFVSISTQPSGTSARLNVNTTSHGFQPGDVLMVCDSKSAAIFMVSRAPGGANPGIGLIHNSGVTECDANNENCMSNDCNYLRFPRCAQGSGKDPKNVFPSGSPVVRFTSELWYIGDNTRGGTSLYRRHLNGTQEEIVEGVAGMVLGFKQVGGDQYRRANATPVPNWGEVNAVRIALTLEAAEGAHANRELQGTDGEVFSRSLSHVVTLRNRMP